MYARESCNMKKAEFRRTYGFESWCWRRLFRIPTRRSNQSILKEINLEYSLEGLKLKLQYFGHLRQRANSLEKTLMLGKIEGRRRRGRQRMRWLEGIINSTEIVKDRKVHGVTKSRTQLSNQQQWVHWVVSGLDKESKDLVFPLVCTKQLSDNRQVTLLSCLGLPHSLKSQLIW